jgi:hypothetical protein
MQLKSLILPPGVDRISAAEFRNLLAGQQGTVNQVIKFIKSLPLKEKKLLTSPDPDEHEEQVAFVLWLRDKGIRHNATPNGGHRAAKTARGLKAEGVVSGFPDITIWPEHGTGRPILYIEMKREMGGRPTSEQLEWLSYLDGFADVRTRICHGAGQAIAFVKQEWGI